MNAPAHLIPVEHVVAVGRRTLAIIEDARDPMFTPPTRVARVRLEVEAIWSLAVEHGAKRGVRWAFWAGMALGFAGALVIAAVVGGGR